MRAKHTWPRLGCPHHWQWFFDPAPDCVIRRPLSIRCQRQRIEEMVRPGSSLTILAHRGPCCESISMISRSSSGSHARICPCTPPGIVGRDQALLSWPRHAPRQQRRESRGRESSLPYLVVSHFDRNPSSNGDLQL